MVGKPSVPWFNDADIRDDEREFEEGPEEDTPTRDGADVGVVQRRGGLGLLEEPLLDRVVASQIRREELDRHMPIQAGIMGLVDDPLPPLTMIVTAKLFGY